jgi:hypothetical protein
MGTLDKACNTISGKYVNKYLESLLSDFKKNHPEISSRVSYDLFHVVTVAFLKENNEGLTTIKVNTESRDELFAFVSETLREETFAPIVDLVEQMKTSYSDEEDTDT